MTDVFISYSRRDSTYVHALAADLEARGKSVWLDTEGIADGEVFPVALQRAIEGSSGFVFVISPAAAESPYCGQEVDLALRLNKRIVPVAHRPVADAALPEGIRVRNWIPGADPRASERVGAALDHDAAHVAAHTRWGLKAIEWDERDGDASLLVRGSELMAAEAWLAGGDGREPAPTDRQRAYIAAGVAAARRRQRRFTGASLAIALLSAVLVVYALISRGEARHERALATSRQLAAEAERQLTADPQLSLLLARRAARIAPSPDALLALRDALDASADRARLPAAGDESCAPANQLAYAPGGRELALGSCSGRLRIVDTGSGRLLRSAQVARAALVPTYSNDGSRLLIGTADGLSLLDARTLRPLRRFDALVSLAQDAAMDATHVAVLTRLSGGTGFVWDLRTGRRHVLDFSAVTYHAVGAAFDRAGRLIVSAEPRIPGRPGALFAFAPSGRLIARREDPDGGGALALTPDGRSAVVVAGRKVVRWSLADLQRRHVVARAAVGQQWTRAAFSPDGRRLLLGDGSGSSRIVRTGGGPPELVLAGQHGAIAGAAFAPDGKRVATVDGEGGGHLWAARPPGATLATVPTAGALAHPDGGVLVAGTDGTLTRAGERVRVPGTRPDGGQAPALDAAGRYVYGRSDGRVTIARLPSLLQTGSFSLDPVNSTELQAAVIPSPSGDRALVLAAAGGNQTAAPVFVDPASAETRVPDGDLPVCAWAGGGFSADGRRAAAASVCGPVVVWDPSDGAALGRFSVDEAQSLAVAPDGRRAAVGTAAGAVSIVTLPAGRPVAQLPGHVNGSKLVIFSPDGRWLITAGDDDELTIFDTRDWELVRRLPMPAHVTAVLPTPDGRFLDVADVTGTVRRYGLCPLCGDVKGLLREAQQRTTRPLTALERRTYSG